MLKPPTKRAWSFFFVLEDDRPFEPTDFHPQVLKAKVPCHGVSWLMLGGGIGGGEVWLLVVFLVIFARSEGWKAGGFLLGWVWVIFFIGLDELWMFMMWTWDFMGHVPGPWQRTRFCWINFIGSFTSMEKKGWIQIFSAWNPKLLHPSYFGTV